MTVRQEPVVARIVLSSASYLNYLNIRKLVTTLFLPSSKSRIIFGKISNLVFWNPSIRQDFVGNMGNLNIKINVTVSCMPPAAEMEQIVNMRINVTIDFGPTAAEIEQIVTLIANVKRNM